MGLLDMPMSGAPKRMMRGKPMMKPPVDMAGKRAPIRKRPKKVKVRQTMNLDALERARGAM